jgi:Fe-S oxidoreductase
MQIKNNTPLPHGEYFRLCSSCGICTPECTVKPGIVPGVGSTATPQEIAKYLLSLEKNGDVHDSSDNSIPPSFICTACGMCDHVCPYYVPFLEKLMAAREWLQSLGTVNVPKNLLEMEGSITATGNPFGFAREKRDEWVREDFPALDRADVVFYPGCQTAYNFFRVETAIMKILKAAGISASLPGRSDQCCGRFLYFLGRSGMMKSAAMANVENVRKKGAKILLANCSSCYLAFKKDYPLMVGNLPFKVMHTTEYINELIGEGRLDLRRPLNKKIIYHDPCELGRIGGVLEAPREALRSLPGVELLEFDRNRGDGLCCGGGGLFEALDEKQAFAIGERLVKEAVTKGADIMAIACPTCNNVFAMARDNLKRKGELGGKLQINAVAEIVLRCL